MNAISNSKRDNKSLRIFSDAVTGLKAIIISKPTVPEQC